jgi:adenosylhomocysteine nucleosidase
MIGITFALPSESSDLVRRLREVQRRDNLIFGKIDSQTVAIAHTGVGEKNCNVRLETLVHKAKPRLVISSGFAGAISDNLHAGELVVAENFSDVQLLANAERILRDARRVKLFTATSIIDSVAERNEIARASGAAAVDMETGAIAAVCNTHGIPLLSLRVISDTPAEPFPAPPSVLFDIERQRTKYGRLISYLFRDPAAAGRLFRFGRRIAKARGRLTDAIIALVHEI